MVIDVKCIARGNHSRWVLLAAAALLAGAVSAKDITMPAELRGIWASDTIGPCNFVVTTDGFEGSSDGEGYHCGLQQDLEVSKGGGWKGRFKCEGEWGEAELTSVITLATTGSQLTFQNKTDDEKMAVTEHEVYFKCG
jgi:hypothetical protein